MFDVFRDRTEEVKENLEEIYSLKDKLTALKKIISETTEDDKVKIYVLLEEMDKCNTQERKYISKLWSETELTAAKEVRTLSKECHTMLQALC